MDSLAYIAPWVLGSVGIGVMAGYFLSRSRPARSDTRSAKADRQATLKVLVEILRSAEKMTNDVASHNTELQQTAHRVESLDAGGDMEAVKSALLAHMESLLKSNDHLQKELMCSRFQMEEQAEQIDHARREARTDTLTGVSNRKAVEERLHMFLAAWERDALPFALIMIDLDYFKRINDSHGHQAGDHVLTKVGGWLRAWTRGNDFIGRYGGDEFVVLLPNTNLDVGAKIAERLRSQAESTASRISLRQDEVSVSFSIGVTAPRQGDTVESILARADQALYKSKHQGRNQVQTEERAQDQIA
jgi:diguanylate cyclase